MSEDERIRQCIKANELRKLAGLSAVPYSGAGSDGSAPKPRTLAGEAARAKRRAAEINATLGRGRRSRFDARRRLDDCPCDE